MRKISGKPEYIGHPDKTQHGRLIHGDRKEKVVVSGMGREWGIDWKRKQVNLLG